MAPTFINTPTGYTYVRTTNGIDICTLFKRSTLLLALAFFSFFSNGSYAQDYNLLTDLDMHWPIPNMAKPGYLETVEDPIFSSKITRVTGNPNSSIPTIGTQWRDIARHGYSKRQVWNADESILMIDRHINGTSPIFVDGETYEVLFTDAVSANAQRWHPTDPNIMVVVTDNEVKAWNVNTGTQTTLMSFSGYSGCLIGPYEGNLSNDGNMVALYATRNSDGKKVGFALDLQNQIKYNDLDLSSMNVDWISVSPLGNYLVVNAVINGGADRTQVYDLNGNPVGSLWSEYGRPSHYDLTVDENGDEVAVGVSKSQPDDGRVIKRRLIDGQVTVLTEGGYAGHTSTRNLQRPGWAFVSFGYRGPTNWQPYYNELAAVKLDGTRVERICHIRGLWDNYENQAHPCPSPSGNRVIYASDWENGSPPVSAYVADFRHLTAGGVNANAGADQTICEGESATLSASGGSNYLWSNGATTQSITVSPNDTTTYTVTVSNGNASDTDTVTVTVNPIPDVTASNDISICEGENTTLTATGQGSFSWSNGGNGNQITVSPTQTTTYTVTTTLNGCTNTDEVTVTVNPSPNVNAGQDVTIQEGESVTLTASGSDNYQWSNGATTASITVSPNATTTYTVTTTQNGCDATDSVTVTVNSETVNANAGPDQSICEGESVTLNASGGSSYEWSNGATTQSITVNPTTTTTYSVIVSNGNASDTDTVTVTVNPIPSVDAGQDITIEEGQTATLTATGSSNYQWSTGETTASITVSPTQTTTYTVTTTENGCSNTDQVTVVVTASSVVATISGNQTICEGESVTLNAGGGSNYLWNTGETSSTIVVTPTQTTTYSVTVSAGSASDTAEVTVTVNPLPEVELGEDRTIVEGESITLSIPENAEETYSWSTNDTTASIEVSPFETTTYTLTVNRNGCIATDTITVIVEPAALQPAMEIYPNPSDGMLHVSFRNLPNISNIRIYDLSGKTVFILNFNEADNNDFTKDLNLTSLQKGIYIMQVYNLDQDMTLTQKIIMN